MDVIFPNIAILVPWFLGLIPWAAGFLILLIINLVTGVLLSWRLKTFDAERITEFLLNGALYFWAWFACELMALLPQLLSIEIPNYAAALADYGPKFIIGLILVGKYVVSITRNISSIIQDIKDPQPWSPDERLKSVAESDIQ